MIEHLNPAAETVPELTAWQRLETIIKMSGMSINAFARCIGLPRGENLYQIKKGNNRISRDLASRIVNYYPQISFSWLLTGEGAMTIDGKTQTGIPFYNCECTADVERIANSEPDGYVAMPGFEDCCAVIAHNWVGKDGIPQGAYVFLHRMEKRYVRMGQYFLVSDEYVGFCNVRTLSKLRKLKVTGSRVPSTLKHLDREEAHSLYLVRGILNVVSK